MYIFINDYVMLYLDYLYDQRKLIIKFSNVKNAFELGVDNNVDCIIFEFWSAMILHPHLIKIFIAVRFLSS